MGRPGCEQCCGKPEPAQCLSCLHACQYAVVNDPALLDKYWDGRVYQPTGFEGDPADLFGSGYSFGYNVTRAYSNFDPEIHPCNQDKFEYIVHVHSCQSVQCIPNGDFDVCVNGENLGTYTGFDPMNPQDVPLFQGLPLFPYSSTWNDPRKCGTELDDPFTFGPDFVTRFKQTLFGTSQAAIDHVVDTNFGFGWLKRQAFGDPILIPPAQRRTLADYNTSIVPKDPFLMDARDIIIDQSGNPSFGPKGGSFDLKLIPNPGINNLMLDTLDRSAGPFGRPLNQIRQDLLDCYARMGTIDPNDIPDPIDVYNGLDPYPIPWNPPSKVHVTIYSLERPVGNDNVTEFRVCQVATACLCVAKEEEACLNFGYRPLCVNPFDSDNYENGQPKFISSEDYDASVACTCNDDEEYEEPQSPGDPNAAPTCYYEADIFVSANLSLPFVKIPPDCARAAGFPENIMFDVPVEAEGDWKGKTSEILGLIVDCAEDILVSTQGTFDPLGGGMIGGGQETEFPYAPIGSALRVARAFKAMVEDALGQTNGCPRSITVGGYVGPFDVGSVFSIYYPSLIYGSLLSNGSANPSDAYVRFEGTFSYHPKALSDALASDIPDGNGGLEFNGTCCAEWVFAETASALNPENNLGNAGGTVRGQVAKFLNIGDTWSTTLGPLLNMDPGDLQTLGFNPCQDEGLANGDAIPLYLDLGNPLAAHEPFQRPSRGLGLGFEPFPDIRATPPDCPNGVDPNTFPPLSVWESVQEKQYYTSDGRALGCQAGFGNQWMGREQTRIEPFYGLYDDEPIVYTFSDLSTGEYYYNLDGGCAGRNCSKPVPQDKLDPCLGCDQDTNASFGDGRTLGTPESLNTTDKFGTTYDLCECAPLDKDPCQPFAEDPSNCADITNGTKEYVLDSDGGIHCSIFCNTGYVLEYDDVTGCAQCVQIQCQGVCNFSWNGNGWNFLPIGSTCPCECEPPNIPGTFVGEIAQGTCVDDIANRVCGEGKCWWTWFVLVGGGGEWRKNAADDPFGFASTCECNCDPPPNDGLFPGDQTATLCFE